MRSFFPKLIVSGFTGLATFVLSRLIIEIFNIHTDLCTEDIIIVLIPFFVAIINFVGMFRDLGRTKKPSDKHE